MQLHYQGQHGFIAACFRMTRLCMDEGPVAPRNTRSARINCSDTYRLDGAFFALGRCLRSHELFEKLGPALKGCEESLLLLYVDDPLVACHDDMASRVGATCLALATRSLRSAETLQG